MLAPAHLPSPVRDPLEDLQNLQSRPHTSKRGKSAKPSSKPLDPRSYVLNGYSRPQTTTGRHVRNSSHTASVGTPFQSAGRRENSPHRYGDTADQQVELLSAVDCARVGLGLPIFQRHDLLSTSTPGDEHHHTHEKIDGELYDPYVYGKGEDAVEIDATKLFKLTERLLSVRAPPKDMINDVIWEEKQHDTRLYDGWDTDPLDGLISKGDRKTAIQFHVGKADMSDEEQHGEFMKCVDRCILRGRSAATARAMSAARTSRSSSPTTRAGSSLSTACKKDKRSAADIKAERAARLAALATPKHRAASAPLKPGARDAVIKKVAPPTPTAIATLKRATSAATVISSRRASVAMSRRASSASSLPQSRRASLAPSLSTPTTPKKPPRPATAPHSRTTHDRPPLSRDEAMYVLKYLQTNPHFKKSLQTQAPSLEYYQQHASAHDQVWNPKAFSVGRFILDYTRMASKLFDPARMRRGAPTLLSSPSQSHTGALTQPAPPTTTTSSDPSDSQRRAPPPPRSRTRPPRRTRSGG
ncbi:hypothetical protein HK097_003001, partial [Rhizophlyctis rosea]